MHVYAIYSPHSYLFFNEDSETLTFVGISITKHGAVIEPQSQKELGIAISSDLQRSLERNKVDFNEDYSKWQK